MDRPRRTTRQPVKTTKVLVASEPTPRVAKRKVDPEQRLNTLLESSKSELVSMELPVRIKSHSRFEVSSLLKIYIYIPFSSCCEQTAKLTGAQEIINPQTWQMLSGDSQSYLKTLLPPTAFTNYLESLGSDHPSIEENGIIDGLPPADTTTDQHELNLSIFTDPHFLAASRTFQDHLYFGWFSAAHLEKVGDFQESVRNGTLAAPWKDEVWNREHRRNLVVVEKPLSSPEKRDDDDDCVEPKTSSSSSSFTILCESSARTGYVSFIHTITTADIYPPCCEFNKGRLTSQTPNVGKTWNHSSWRCYCLQTILCQFRNNRERYYRMHFYFF